MQDHYLVVKHSTHQLDHYRAADGLLVTWSNVFKFHMTDSNCHLQLPVSEASIILNVHHTNKTYLLSPEAQSSAMMFDCLYLELSASLDHGTNELLEAAVRTARGDCVGPGWTDGDPGAGRRESLTSRAKRFLSGLVPRSYGRDRDRDRGRYREMSRHRGSKILRQKSRSCHDLSALWHTRTHAHAYTQAKTHSYTCIHTPDWKIWGRGGVKDGEFTLIWLLKQ